MRPKPYRVPTSCCAMNQLVANSAMRFRDLEKLVNDTKIESTQDWSEHRQGGPKALFCMTVTPFENHLEENLQKLGFEMIRDGMNRREGYDPAGKIRMWMLNW